MAKLPPALVESLRLRQVVIVAGARCSELAELPAWPALAASLNEWIEEPGRRDEIKALLEGGRALAALARLRDILPEDLVAEVIADAVKADQPIPAAFAAVSRIPWRLLVSTATDDLWERATDDPAQPTRVVLPGQAHDLDKPGRVFLPLFGRASAPDSLCVGPRDVRSKVALTPTGPLLAEAHRRWSFVFVGFRPDDPDLALVAQRLLGASASEREDFLLCPGASEAEALVTGAELALTAIPVEGDLAAVLESLAESWDTVKETSRPPLEDVEGWMELWARDPGDAEAPRVLTSAADRLRGTKDWERLLTLLVQRAELEREPSAQVAALREVGRIFDAELGQPDRAYRALVTALRLEPDDLDLVADLKRLARRAGLWDEFVQDYGAMVQTMGDPADSAAHAIEIGRIYAEDSARHDQAIASFEKVLAHDPGSPEALSGLEALYRQTERWNDLVVVLGAREARAGDATLRRKLRTERIEILLGRLHDGPAAIEALEAAVSDDPDDRVALRSLEALYKEQHREPERLATLERLLPLAESDEERIGLWRRLAAGQRSRSDGAAAAIASLERAFALGDRHEDTMEALASAHEQRGDWRALAEVLDRWSELGTPETRAQLMARAGKVYLEKLIDSAAGEERYARALELDPRNPAVLTALAQLSRERGDFFRAAKFMLESEERTRNPLEKARLLHSAAVIHQDQLDDEAKATELYARALQVDPGHASAAMRLAPLYEKAGAWEALEPVLDMLARRGDGPDASVADLHRRLGECARKLGKADKALKSFESARSLAPDSPPVLRGLGDLQLEKQAWAEARAHYDSLMRLSGSSLPVEEKADLLERLGRCEAHLDEPESARRRFEEAVALELPAAAIDRKVQLFEQLGDLCLEKLHRPEDAIVAYGKALTLSPQRRPLLHRLLGLYTEHKRWPGALAMLAKLAELEPAPALRAKYHYTAGVIQRDELSAPAEALALLEKALDDDPDLHKAFEAVERLHTEAQDWKELARAYRRMIRRLPDSGMNEVKARLWNGLGVVALRYLGDREAAILALEVASKIERENMARHELLADLYVEVGPAAIDKAIAEHQFIVSRRPDRIESYQALAALFQQRRAYDQLWCVAGALTHLGQADHYLRTFWERHRMAEVPVAMRKMDHEQWQKVVHPKEDPFISGLFALLHQFLALTTAQRHQTVGVKRSERIDLTSDWLPAAALRYVSSSMELPLPDLFMRESDPQTVSIYNLRDRGGLTPALVLGQGVMQWSSQWEVVFDLGKRMAFLRPERFPRFALMTPAALDVAVRAALALGGAPIGHGPHNGEVERTRSQLAELVPQPLAHELSLAAKRFLEARGEVIDIPSWIAAADLTAARAAFVLSSDLPSAVRVLSAEPAGLTPIPLAERIKDLVAYSVSEEYFTVRQAMGLQVV